MGCMPARATTASRDSIGDQLREALAWLKAHSSKATRDGMARYAIPSQRALGVAMKDIKTLGKRIGRNQALADALWETDVYEARMLTSFVGDPNAITSAQMDAWCKQFDNWAICDTLCFNLFDRTPHAWKKLGPWSRRSAEFEKRTAFALLWSLALHDREASDQAFLAALPLIVEAADDDRNFVWKAVAMALKAVGKRNPRLRKAALELAERLTATANPAAQRIGKDALRELGPKDAKRSR